MNQDNWLVYNNFYKTTIGKFYTKEQRQRLLRLFALVSGLDEGSAEYKAIFRRVDVLDKQNILSYTESKNYSMVSSIFLDDSEMHSAVNALVFAHKSLSEKKSDPSNDNKVSWIISLRKSPPENVALRMELALFEYSTGNISAAVNEFKELINRGVLPAVELLACIHRDMGENEEVFYYYSLLKKVYTKELKMSPPLSTGERTMSAKKAISEEKAIEILKKIEAAPCFLEQSFAGSNTIGFVSAETRRFAYEH